MADVFISYDENSAGDIVRQISETLERGGISCWYAGRDMEKGELRGVVTEAIEDCRIFLLLLNENALKSAYVQSEIALVVRGFDDGKARKRIALRTDNAPVDAQLSEFLERLQARDDFPSDIKPFRIVNVFPANLENLWQLKMLIKHCLKPPKPPKGYYIRLPEKYHGRTRILAKSAKQKKALLKKVAALKPE